MKAFILCCAVLVATTCAAADTWPTRSVRVIIPYGPGGATDFIARVLTAQLGKQTGQAFVADNRAGAGGTIGNSIAARAQPDGYTLLLVDPSFAISPGLFKSLPYDVTKDFTPITEVVEIPQALVVNPALDITSLKALVAMAKENPGKLNYGSAGIGGTIHLSSELFKNAAGVNIQHVPYSGGGGAMMTGLLGGQVQMVITAIPTLLPYVKSGKLTALATTMAAGKHPASLPDVPSMADAGVQGMTVYLWFGLVGPAGMPRDLVDAIHKAVETALADPTVKAQLAAQGEVVTSSPEAFGALIKSEVTRWGKVTQDAGIALE